MSLFNKKQEPVEDFGIQEIRKSLIEYCAFYEKYKKEQEKKSLDNFLKKVCNILLRLEKRISKLEEKVFDNK